MSKSEPKVYAGPERRTTERRTKRGTNLIGDESPMVRALLQQLAELRRQRAALYELAVQSLRLIRDATEDAATETEHHVGMIACLACEVIDAVPETDRDTTGQAPRDTHNEDGTSDGTRRAIERDRKRRWRDKSRESGAGLARAEIFTSSLSYSEEERKSKQSGEFQDLNGKTRTLSGRLATGAKVPGQLGDAAHSGTGQLDGTSHGTGPAAAISDSPEQKSETRRKPLGPPDPGHLTQSEIDARRAEQLKRLSALEPEL